MAKTLNGSDPSWWTRFSNWVNTPYHQKGSTPEPVESPEIQTGLSYSDMVKSGYIGGSKIKTNNIPPIKTNNISPAVSAVNGITGEDIKKFNPLVKTSTNPGPTQKAQGNSKTSTGTPSGNTTVGSGGTVVVPAVTNAVATPTPSVPSGLTLEQAAYGEYSVDPDAPGNPLFDLIKKGTANTSKEGPIVTDPLDQGLKDLNDQTDETMKMTGLINAGKGLLNVGIIANELSRKPTDPFVSPRLTKPKFISPGQYIRASSESSMAMLENTAQKLLQETGRSDAVIGVTADVMDKSNQLNAQTTAMDIETANKNIDTSVQIDNQQAAIDAETRNKNIEKTMQENLASGMTITQAINALGEIGTQHVASMSEAEYKKWVAGMMMEKIKLQRGMMAAGMIPGMEDLMGGRQTLVPGTTTTPVETEEIS